MNYPARLLALLASFSFVSCGSNPPPKQEQIQAAPRLYNWADDGGPGEVKIRINLSSQRAYYTRGDRPIGWSYVATGKEGKNTPAGKYKITEKIADKYSNLYGWIENEYGETIDSDASPGDPVPTGARYVAAPMPYWMRLTSYGIGMHAGHIPQPGEPASHGCIRLPKPFAPLLFDAIKVGTPVTIEYGPASDPWEVHPAPPPPTTSPPPFIGSPGMRDGRRVVSPDDPNIIWPEGHPYSNGRPWDGRR